MTTSPPYNPNVPLRRDPFNVSQGDFLTNFMTLYTAFSANHVALDAASNAGNHNIIQMLEQPIGSQFQTDVGEISIYCKTPVDPKNMPLDQGDQLFVKYQGNVPEFQLSAYQIYGLNVLNEKGVIQTPYFTFLPGKILVYFGTIQCTLPFIGGSSAPLYLRPPIATNIIGMDFCPLGTTPTFPPMVSIRTKNSNGFYDTIYLQNPQASTAAPANQVYFYMVLANI